MNKDGSNAGLASEGLYSRASGIHLVEGELKEKRFGTAAISVYHVERVLVFSKFLLHGLMKSNKNDGDFKAMSRHLL